MAKTKRRSRNIARKPKSRPAGFVSQKANAASNAFVPQEAEPPSNHTADTASDPAPGFVPQNPTADAPSTKRAATNRANAQHSTGPRTAEGKARSSQNARKHGLSLQRHAILRHEDPAAYDRLHEELAAIYEPTSPREHLALEEITQCRWALHRFDHAEAALLEYHFAREADPANEPDRYMSYGRSLGYTCIMEHREPTPLELPSLLLLHRYRTHWDRSHQRALAEFDRARKDHRQQLRDAERQQESARKAEREAAAERRREELHQLRLAQAQAKIAQAQANLAREQARTTEHQARATARKSKADEDSFFNAIERILSATPNTFRNGPGAKPNSHAAPEPAPGFVPQNQTFTEETTQTAHPN